MKMNKFICLLMAVLMLLTVSFPVAVFADDDALVEEEAYIDVAEDEAVQEEYVAEEEYIAEDVLPEQEEEIVIETGLIEEAEEPQEAQETEETAEPAEAAAVDTELEAEGEDNDFDASYVKITEQPKDAAGAAGTKVTFHVTAKNVVNYQWQVSTDNGANWITAGTKYYDGTTTDTITVPVKAARDGFLFRCAVTGASGKTVYTNVAKLTVGAGLTITEQPKAASGAVGTKVTFHVAATNAASYQWQVSANDGATWTEAKAKYYSGVTTDTITVPVKAARDGYLFRCVVSDSASNSVNSDGAKLTVASNPTITEQPKDASGAVGTKVTFHVAATNAASYQWQVSANDGATWTEAKAKYYSGVTTDTITVPVKDARDGYLFRCVVSASNGLSTNSDSAKLTVENKITVNGVIYEKLTDTTCAVVGYTGNDTSYTVEKTVNGMTVTEIGAEAFMGNTKLQSITLPDTITIIRARAFKGCTSLSKMG